MQPIKACFSYTNISPYRNLRTHECEFYSSFDHDNEIDFSRWYRNTAGLQKKNICHRYQEPIRVKLFFLIRGIGHCLFCVCIAVSTTYLYKKCHDSITNAPWWHWNLVIQTLVSVNVIMANKIYTQHSGFAVSEL